MIRKVSIPLVVGMIVAAGLCGVSPASIVPALYYPVIMGFFAILSICFDYPRSEEGDVVGSKTGRTESAL